MYTCVYERSGEFILQQEENHSIIVWLFISTERLEREKLAHIWQTSFNFQTARRVAGMEGNEGIDQTQEG